jgi:hypothetical protein
MKTDRSRKISNSANSETDPIPFYFIILKVWMANDDKNYCDDKLYWVNSLAVTGILAGITFSSLLILIEAKNNIISPDWFPWKEDYFVTANSWTE